MANQVMVLNKENFISALADAASELATLTKDQIKEVQKRPIESEPFVLKKVFSYVLEDGSIDPFRSRAKMIFDRYPPETVSSYIDQFIHAPEESLVSPFEPENRKEIALTFSRGSVSSLSLMQSCRDLAYILTRAEDHTDLLNRAENERLDAIHRLAEILSKDGEEPVLVELQSNPFFKRKSEEMEAAINMYSTKYRIDVFIAASAYYKAIERSVSDLSARIFALKIIEKLISTGDTEFDLESESVQNSTTFSNKPEVANEISDLSSDINTTKTNKTILLTAASVLEQVDDYLEAIETNNHLCVEYPEHIAFVRDLKSNLTSFIEHIPVGGAKEIVEVNEAKSRWQNILHLIKSDIELRTSDQAIAEKALPLGVILGCGGIGALLGGPLGFGAGAWVGKLVVGEKKPSAVADKVEEALADNPDSQ